MPTRLPSLLRPPIGFAHRGASAHEQENTLDAFRLAIRLGATGLESDVWLTADRVPVLDHDGEVGGRLRKRPISELQAADLPDHIPTLEALYDACGTAMPLSLDVKDADAFDRVIATARSAGGDALERLWLCHWDWEVAAGWRQACAEVRLVDSTRVGRMKQGPERRAADLRDAGIDAVNLHHSEWSGGLVALFHRFDRCAFGWDAQFDRIIDGLFDMGIDAVYSDHVDRLAEALSRV